MNNKPIQPTEEMIEAGIRELMENIERRCYTTGAKIFLAVYVLALVAAIAGVVHYV